MDWKSGLKWVAILTTAGVITAVAIELVTGRIQQMAALAAKAELQHLMVAAAAEKQAEQPPVGSVLTNDRSGKGYATML